MINILRLFSLGLILAAITFVAYLLIRSNQPSLDAASYDQCLKISGAKQLLTDPPKCITPEGTIFIKN